MERKESSGSDVGMNDLSRFSDKVNAILEMEREWRKDWKHKCPLCEEWQNHINVYGYGFCKHYAKARKDKFRRPISELWDMTEWDGKLYSWVYISNR